MSFIDRGPRDGGSSRGPLTDFSPLLSRHATRGSVRRIEALPLSNGTLIADYPSLVRPIRAISETETARPLNTSPHRPGSTASPERRGGPLGDNPRVAMNVTAGQEPEQIHLQGRSELPRIYPQQKSTPPSYHRGRQTSRILPVAFVPGASPLGTFQPVGSAADTDLHGRCRSAHSVDSRHRQSGYMPFGSQRGVQCPPPRRKTGRARGDRSRQCPLDIKECLAFGGDGRASRRRLQSSDVRAPWLRRINTYSSINGFSVFTTVRQIQDLPSFGH
jgi:hypothetical protein